VSSLKLDEVDSAILALLRENGRMSNREVGRALEVSEGTVRQRLRKLVDAKVMRLGLVTDIHTTGLSVGVTVRIRADPGRTRAIAQALAALESTSFVALTLGRFDILTVLAARSRIEAAETIDNQIANIEGVLSIDVQEPVSYPKHRYDMVYITGD
jgi:Lrp/AsnC family transcriptional regulator for asnA, asnC and gidA